MTRWKLRPEVLAEALAEQRFKKILEKGGRTLNPNEENELIDAITWDDIDRIEAKRAREEFARDRVVQ